MHPLTVTYQNILRLDISVDYVALLQVNKCFHYLSNHKLSFSFIEILLSPQSLKKIATWTVLQHCVDILLVVEVAVEAHYVWMIKSPLNFELFFHLTEKVKFFKG